MGINPTSHAPLYSITKDFNTFEMSSLYGLNLRICLSNKLSMPANERRYKNAVRVNFSRKCTLYRVTKSIEAFQNLF